MKVREPNSIGIRKLGITQVATWQDSPEWAEAVRVPGGILVASGADPVLISEEEFSSEYPEINISELPESTEN